MLELGKLFLITVDQTFCNNALIRTKVVYFFPQFFKTNEIQQSGFCHFFLLLIFFPHKTPIFHRKQYHISLLLFNVCVYVLVKVFKNPLNENCSKRFQIGLFFAAPKSPLTDQRIWIEKMFFMGEKRAAHFNLYLFD